MLLSLGVSTQPSVVETGCFHEATLITDSLVLDGRVLCWSNDQALTL